MADAERSGPVGPPRAGSRSGAALAALWLLAGLLAVRQAAAAPRFPWTPGTLLLVVAVALVAARALPGGRVGGRPGDNAPGRRTAMLAAPVAVILTVVSLPVRNAFTLGLGPTGVIPVLLVLLGCCARGPGRTTGVLVGVLVGVAAALQPAVLLFAALLWLTGRRRAAIATGATFAVCTALAWAALPDDSWTYWVHHTTGVGLGERPDGLANQSLHGLLLRIGLRGPVEILLYGLSAALVVRTGLRRAARYARDGQPLLATAITGCVAVAVSPTAWQHQQLWILLAVVGRTGRRRADRLVWPVLVVLVMTLTSTVLVSPNPVLGPIGRNAPLLTALAAACAVPFLTRSAALWDRLVPTPVAQPQRGRYRWVPLLRFKRALNRPNVLLELMLIRVGYWAYSYIRAQAPDSRALAESHGRQILAVEEFLRLDVEHGVNHFVAGVDWLADGMDYYYGTFHFLVPMSLLGYLYWRRPATYRWARTSLALATLVALAGFWLYPLAPPRLMPGLGFIDTANGPQDLSHPDYGALTELANQYAAMPSLHIGWSLWCGIVIAVVGPKTGPKAWTRWLGMLYPLMTFSVIVGTANHYVLDAVGGALVVAAGFGIQYVLTGPGRVALAAIPGARRGDAVEAATEREPVRAAG
ncbi:bifunctional glycosyltransferase 87/phosphatase PAP2 family protein [Streptomyces hesseae]|uniref:Bifunctional glycosyltransferase 87/phosphatase PAP2 family protein n=1 Tax=Streptomyces hesseae TaxID=3075519 RepID=A0ABU2T095_9ACTN|nr:bifunctional glycosyltransferase 87/phosphatase PAP2 family protein [Streptomyces sp. DSM 40473]MDT0454039.1 bifunctional glycosyltransferase 87/phosphatase PAP2 family protein [Streptomyces sp. DSM 40473]